MSAWSRRRLDVFWIGLGILFYGLLSASFLATSPFARLLVLDAYHFDTLAKQLTLSGFRPEGAFHQAPLYPYALALPYALVGPKPLVPFLFQILLAGTFPWLAFRIAKRHFGVRAGHAAAALTLFYGPLVAFAPRLLATVPAVWLQLILLARWPAREAPARRWWEIGAWLALTTLLRPNVLLFAAWILFAGLFAKRLPARAAVASLVPVALVVIASVAYHVAIGAGPVVLSANGGETFYHGNNPRAAGTYALMAGLESADITTQAEVSRAIAERETGRTLNASEVSRFWFRQGVSFIREDPGRFAWLMGQKLRRLLGAEESPDIYSPDLEAAVTTPAYRLAPLRLTIVLPLALAGIVTAWRTLPFPWVGLVATHVVSLLVFYVSNRYRLPLEALLLLPAGAALANLRERRTLVAIGIGVLLATGVRLTPSPGNRAREEALLLTNLGASYAKSGDFDRASDVFRLAVARDGSWSRGHLYLGRALVRRGAIPEAIAHYRRAAELDPENVEVRADLAVALLSAGECEAAREALGTAEGARPDAIRARIASVCGD